jgi:CRP/FNR family transcriptional regulator
MAVFGGEISLSDVLETCKKCKLAPMCLPNGLAADQIEKIEKIVHRIPSIKTNKHLYKFGEPFDSLYIVRSGCIKEYTITHSGDEQVFGFKYTGEIFGLDSINEHQYVSSALPLVTSTVCKISYSNFEKICDDIPGLAKQVLNMISHEITAQHDFRVGVILKSAEQKLAFFLSNESMRLKRLGYSEREFNLPMTRADIATYLGITVETTSRTLSHFVQEGIIKVNKRNVKISDLGKLQLLAEHCSACPATISKAS